MQFETLNNTVIPHYKETINSTIQFSAHAQPITVNESKPNPNTNPNPKTILIP